MSVDPTKFPRVSWEEARDHIVKRLLIDDDAVLLVDKGLHWWPGFLRQDVYIAQEGEYGQGSQDNWLQLVGETHLAFVNEPDLGFSLADQINGVFVHGAAIYIDDVVLLRTAYVFNPLNRGLLKVFHEQLLAQITLAHEFATKWENLSGIEICLSHHPETGPREKPDELLNIYWGDECSNKSDYNHFEEGLEAARALIPEIMIGQGWEPGFENDDVSYFSSGSASVGMGVRPKDPENRKYGFGVFVLANDLNYQHSVNPIEANLLNTLAAELEHGSQFGPFVSENYSSSPTVSVVAFIPHGALAEDRFSHRDLALTVTNFAIHVASSCVGTFALLNSRISSTNHHEGGVDEK